MKRSVAFLTAVGFLVLVGCNAQPTTSPEGLVRSVNPVMTEGGEEIGESEITRTTNKIEVTLNACCLIPGNAYTAWWLIGDVTKPMNEVRTMWAAGWVANGEEVNLQLELEAGGGTVRNVRNTHEGVRIVVLDHGTDSGSSQQLSTPEGGCGGGMCPTVFETAHPAP